MADISTLPVCQDSTPLEAVKSVKKENLPTNKITISLTALQLPSYDSDGIVLKIGIATLRAYMKSL